jgi:hypothetical protein
MTKQAKLGLDRRRLTTKTLAANAIATVALITMIGIIISTSERDVDAQTMGNHGNHWVGNMTSNAQELEQKLINNGKINLEQTIFEAIRSKINTSLTEAMTIAEQSIANDSFALAAFGASQGGYFAYGIIVGIPEMKFYHVKVDPGTGQILATQEQSQRELERMHEEHSAEVVRNGGGSSISGFPFLIPH